MVYDELRQTHPDLFDNNDFPLKIIFDKPLIINREIENQINHQNYNDQDSIIPVGIVLDDPFIIAIRDLVEFPDGSRGGYVRIYSRAFLEDGNAGVVILPIKDKKILLMHNFRHATRAWHWEIPRGFGEVGKTAEEQARAEMQEEVSADIKEIVDLGTFYNNTGLEGDPVNLFLGRIEADGVVNSSIGVDKLRWVTLEELETMIASNEITDGFTIAAYTRAKLKGLL